MACILVVDDCRVTRFLIKNAIEHTSRDVEIIEAENGRKALEVLETKSEEIDFILLDINMPIMTGIEFLKIYSQHSKHIPTYILSSSNLEQDRAATLQYPCVKDYLTKPIGPEEVIHLFQ